jgi:hypothetical protein
MKMNSLYRFRPESNQNRVTNYNECAGARHWDCMVVYDADFFTSPVAVEFRRNNLHGIYQIPGFCPGSGSLTGDSTGQVIKNEYNLLYATNYAAYNQGPTQETWQPLGMDIHAEHPGLRLSWQRNEGFIGWYNTAGDDSAPLYGLKDFMRADYNFCQVTYDPIIQKAGWDFIRIYRPADDSVLPKTQFSIYSKTAVPFQIYVEFEYRLPFRIDRAYNISIVNGLGILAAQNGVALSGYPAYILKPTNSDWYRYSATITGFASAIGVATVSIVHRSTEFTADLRNMRAYVMTNNPNEIVTLGNTFDVNKYFNIANKFKKVKF